MAERDFTEFEGGGLMPNGVFPKAAEALTPSDKLRLMSTTGQTEDSRAKVDPGFWQGNNYFDADAAPKPDREWEAKQRRIQQMERQMYRETPRPR